MLLKSELTPLTSLRQVIPHQNFIPTYSEIKGTNNVVARYPLGLIRLALREYIGKNVMLDRLSNLLPDIVLNSGKIHELSGSIPAPITAYIQNIYTGGRTQYAPDTSLLMDPNGDAHNHYWGVLPASFPLRISSPTRGGRVFFPELEKIGNSRKDESLIQTLLDQSIGFKVSPVINFQGKHLGEHRLTPEIMAKKGLDALEQLLESFRSAISTGIVYSPDYCQPVFSLML